MAPRNQVQISGRKLVSFIKKKKEIFSCRVDDTPREAGLMFTCKKGKDYLGKKALEEEKRKGLLKKRKVCLTLDK